MMILPSQARDKYREGKHSKKRCDFRKIRTSALLLSRTAAIHGLRSLLRVPTSWSNWRQSVLRKTHIFLRFLSLEWSFYQDWLGTNIGKR